jgi:hypothetical protein
MSISRQLLIPPCRFMKKSMTIEKLMCLMRVIPPLTKTSMMIRLISSQFRVLVDAVIQWRLTLRAIHAN